MIVNRNALDHCSQEIFRNVLRYAYENAKVPPLLIDANVEWFGEIFNVSEIDKDLFRDITHYLKQEKLYNEIKERCDKYVILPDVFSEQLYPKSYYKSTEVDENGIKDHGIPNIVIINGKVFELIDEKVNGIKFCYSGKLYYFYDSSIPEASLLQSETPTFNVIDVKKWTEFDFDEKYPIGEEIEGSFMLQLDLDNKVIDEDSEVVPTDYITLKIDYPYSKFSYDSSTIVSKGKVRGLHSTQPLDTYIQEKIYDDREDKFIMHNRNASFCETAIIIYKDNTYKILNDSFSVELNRIDKHTVEFYRNPNVKEIIVFYKPVLIESNVSRVDSLYDDVMGVSDYGFYDLRRYKKNTSNLYQWLTSKYPSVEEIIRYGYEFDLDVLKAVQMSFPTMLRLDESYLHVSKEDPNGTKSKTNQLFLNIPNNIMLRPLVFIDNELHDSDQNMYNGQKLTIVHLNMDDYPEINNVLKTSDNPEADVRELFKTKHIDVALLSDLTEGGTIGNFKEFKGRMKHSPSTVVSKSEFEGIEHSTYFVNGRASIGTDHDSLLYKVPVYDIGMSTDLKVLLLGAKFISDDYRFTKINHIERFMELRYSSQNQGLFNKTDLFATAGYMAFNHNGLLANDDIQVVTNDYATFSNGIFKYPNQDTAGLRYIKLPKVNLMYNLDLEIDYSKVNTVTNVGTYNEKSIESNPNILEYFKTGAVFPEKDYDLNMMTDEECKNLSDALASFGSVGVNPFNINDYRSYLSMYNIESVDPGSFLPKLDTIPEEFHKAMIYHNIPVKIYSNIWYAELLKNKSKYTVVHDPNFDFSLNPQMDWYLQNGLSLGVDINLIPLDVDLEMTFTPDFLDPPSNDPYKSLRGAKIEQNVGLDKQQNLILPPQSINEEDMQPPIAENVHIPNGNFDTDDTTGWKLNSPWEISDGALRLKSPNSSWVSGGVESNVSDDFADCDLIVDITEIGSNNFVISVSGYEPDGPPGPQLAHKVVEEAGALRIPIKTTYYKQISLYFYSTNSNATIVIDSIKIEPK